MLIFAVKFLHSSLRTTIAKKTKKKIHEKNCLKKIVLAIVSSRRKVFGLCFHFLFKKKNV